MNFLNNKHRQFIYSFWLGFAVLLSLNILIWFYLTQIRQQFSSELQTKLTDINTLMSHIIDESKISNIIPGETTSPEYLYYQQIIEELRLQSSLQSIRIISPLGQIILAAPETKSGASATGVLFKEALKGTPQVSDIESYVSQKFMSAYMPLIDLNGFVSAVIVIEAKAEHFNLLDNFRNRILFLTAINLIAILLIVSFLSRMLKRTIQYQTEIKEKHHLAQIGTMAATVAHELRNPLAIIQASSSIIKKKYDRNEDELFTYISDEVKRLDILIDDFLKLTGSPTLHITKFDLGTLFDKISLSFTEEEIQSYSFEMPEKMEIISDRNIIEQITLNLIRNAFQAFNDKKTDKKIIVKVKPEKNDYINITIRDNGSGISQENLNNVFNPFFTTKEKGTGLGLPVSKRLTELLGGSITIHSEIGKGTEISIHLPLHYED